MAATFHIWKHSMICMIRQPGQLIWGQFCNHTTVFSVRINFYDDGSMPFIIVWQFEYEKQTFFISFDIENCLFSDVVYKIVLCLRHQKITEKLLNGCNFCDNSQTSRNIKLLYSFTYADFFSIL